MNGWMGKILRVNLSRGDYKVESLEPTLARRLIGGRGLAANILYDEIDPATDPLGPENKLIFATGPLTGSGAITGCRYAVVTKSPLTGAFACSTSAGYFGPELKFAGYDLIIFEGRSPHPVYLVIDDDDVEIMSASYLWGLPTNETENIIRARMKDPWRARETYIASIGPAGEKQVRCASIVNDKHWAAARSGVGAVMGSKNLKAIVVSGSKEISLSDYSACIQIIQGVLEEIKAAPLTAQTLPDLGTAFLIDVMNRKGALATKNFQSGVFEGADKINAQALAKTILRNKRGCLSCPIACHRLTKVADSPFQGSGLGPDYETLAAFGACCGIDNLAAIAKANYLCAELGLDPISAGVTIACAMELYEKRILPEKDVGGKLNFGNAEAMLELLRLMAKRQGFGDALAEGAWRLAQKYDHPEFFIGVKRQEAPPYDPRAIQGLGLQYATSNTGACHDSGYVIVDEILGVHQIIDPLGTRDKASLVKLFQDVTAMIDSCGLCFIMLLGGIWVADVFTMLETVTGAGYTEQDLLLAGEKTWNLERLFNLKAGLGARDDTLPRRMLEEPMPEGPARGQVVRLDEMLPEYYKLRGWDHNGVPTPEKLAELELDKKTVEKLSFAMETSSLTRKD